MRTVYKYNFQIEDAQTIVLPSDYIVRHIGLDPLGLPAIWCEISTDCAPKSVTLCITGTGHVLPDHHKLTHIGSFVDGPYVWHAWIAI